MVAAFLIIGSVANAALFGVHPLGSMNMFNAVGLALAAVAVRTRHPTVRATTTALYGIYLAARREIDGIGRATVRVCRSPLDFRLTRSWPGAAVRTLGYPRWPFHGKHVAPVLKMPDWTLTLVVWIGIIGFPFALFLAWAFE